MGMSTPSPQDDVSKRMEALVDLLKAASTFDDNVMIEKELERKKRTLQGSLDLPEHKSQQEWDEEIISLTKQLQTCIQDTPERMEIKELQPVRVTSYAEPTTSRRSKRPPRGDDKKKRQQHNAVAHQATQEQEPTVDRREQLQREYSEMSYPKIGPGYSDTISVVSDLSIPTVVTNLYVAEEEHYKDLPQHISATSSPSPKRQPSLGSNMMAHPTPHVEDEETTLMAPSLVAAPSVVLPAPSIVMSAGDELRAPSQRVVQVPPKRAGAAAQRRRQSHQAVLAHLQHQTATANTQDSTMRRSSMPTKLTTQSTKPTTTSLTVNDLPPLNFPKDEPSEYGGGWQKKSAGGKRRSLLSRGNKYAASVTATSTRMLLSSQKKQATPTPKPTRPSLLNRSGNKQRSPTSSPSQNVDLDGVLSTMNCDIDFIFQELSVLEDSKPTPVVPSTTAATRNTTTTSSTIPTLQQDSFAEEESNIGATAKIKYTLTSVARTLRHDSQEGLLKQDDDMNWESLNDPATNSTAEKSSPVLIDEDGFIVTDGGTDDPFGQDSFAPKPNDTFAASKSSSSATDPFSNSFFPNAKKESKKKTKKRTSLTDKKVQDAKSSISPESVATKESRIDAVELATKKRIEMLRRLVEYRARHVSEDSKRSGKGSDELEKLDFVEAETMKQIARLRDRLGASRRELGQE